MSVLHGEEEAGVGGEANSFLQLETLPHENLRQGQPLTKTGRRTDKQVQNALAMFTFTLSAEKNGVLEDEGHKSSLKQKGEIWADFDS